MEFLETTYGFILNKALGIANPVKKRIIKTECEVHRRFKKVTDYERRYHLVTKCALPLAKRTTAGAMVMFYGDVFSKP